MPQPAVNVLWVGPPKSQLSAKILASDASNVIDLAKKATNPINFWCLAEHAEHYKALFKEQGAENIQVQSIEAYINEVSILSKKFHQYSEKMKHLQQVLLTPPRNKIIDKVGFKDALSLFILATSGGYTLDSNIKLDTEGPYTFPAFDAPRLPFNVSPEVWLMYAQPQSPEFAEALDTYLSQWDAIQAIIEKDPNDPECVYEFHSEITGSMAGSVQEIFNDLLDDEETRVDWAFTFIQEENLEGDDNQPLAQARFNALPVVKEYGNSHKPWHAANQIIDIEYNNLMSLSTPVPPRLIDSLQKLNERRFQECEDRYSLVYQDILTYHSLRCVQHIATCQENFSHLSPTPELVIAFQQAVNETYNELTAKLTEILNKESLPFKPEKEETKALCLSCREKVEGVLKKAEKEKIARYKEGLGQATKRAANDDLDKNTKHARSDRK